MTHYETRVFPIAGISSMGSAWVYLPVLIKNCECTEKEIKISYFLDQNKLISTMWVMFKEREVCFFHYFATVRWSFNNCIHFTLSNLSVGLKVWVFNVCEDN